MKPPEENCGSCKFNLGDGLCRRFPPARLTVHDSGVDIHNINLWPEVSNDEWCGEYQKGTTATP